MDETENLTFEVENYRKGTISATIHYTDGEWSSDTPLGEGMIDTANHRFQSHEERVRYFSTYTNQVLASRLVEED